MTLLTFNNKYIAQSTTLATTTLTSFQDDSPSSIAFSLSANQTVLAIYQSNGTTGIHNGMQSAINIDGVDHANSLDSSTNFIFRNMIFWIGTLSSGSHTIKGRFSAISAGDTITISNRILLVYIFNGNEFQYVESSTSINTSNYTTFQNDSAASVTFTPSGNCKALYLYNITNVQGAAENYYGKIAAINVAGIDYSQAEKSNLNYNYQDSIFTCYANSLSAISTTVTGRYMDTTSYDYVTINYRQLGVLLLDNSTLLDPLTQADTQVSTTSNSLVNDAQATISRITSDTRELLVVAVGTKRYNTISDTGFGEAYGISVDSVDRQLSRGAPCNIVSSRANSAATCWAQTLSSGSHTIQGRFSNNSGSTNAVIDSRRIYALWLLAVGNVYFTSTPSGASIYIDSILQGETTPATVTGLSAGSHSYKLYLAGYNAVTGNFSTTTGQTTTVPTILLSGSAMAFLAAGD